MQVNRNASQPPIEKSSGLTSYLEHQKHPYADLGESQESNRQQAKTPIVPPINMYKVLRENDNPKQMSVTPFP